MRWTKVRQLPAGVVLLLMVASVLATVVAFRPWGSGEIDEVSAAGEIVAKRNAGFLHVTSDALAPYFALTNQDGQPVSLDDYQGKWLVMDWVYTSCLTTCPALTANMKMLLDGLGEHAGPEVELVSITFDPDRDTPAVMKSYSEKVGGDVPEWAWLTGARQDTDAVADAYDKVYGPAIGIKNLGHFDHTALVVVIDPEGIERHRYFGTGWSQDLLTRLEPDLIAMRLDEEKIPQVSEIGDQTIAVEPEHTDSAPSERTPLVSALGTAESLRATAKEFKGETGDAFDDIDSEFVLQFKAEGAASSWLRAQVIEAVDAGWRVMEAEPPDGAGFEYTLLEGPDGTYLGVARELWMALEITGTNPSRVYAMLFYAQGLCCFFG
jgi:protein SCO1